MTVHSDGLYQGHSLIVVGDGTVAGSRSYGSIERWQRENPALLHAWDAYLARYDAANEDANGEVASSPTCMQRLRT